MKPKFIGFELKNKLKNLYQISISWLKVFFRRIWNYFKGKKGIIIPLSVFFFLFLPLIKYFVIQADFTVRQLIADVIFSILSPAFATIIIERKSIFPGMKPDFEAELAKTKDKLQIVESERNNLENLVEKFFQDGKFTRRGVSDLFKINTSDYFCIVKSAENLEQLYKKRKEIDPDLKFSQSPFGKILNDYPGALKPFGNIDMYFFPHKVLQRHKSSIAKWMEREIIPKVNEEREKYVKTFGKKLKLTPSEIKQIAKPGYVYLGYELNPQNVAFDIKGQSINSDLFKIVKGSKDNLLGFTREINNAINSKGLFLRVEWNTIIAISNRAQMSQLNEEAERISELLRNQAIQSITQIADMRSEDLSVILFKALKKHGWTQRVCDGKAVLIITSIANLLSLLRKMSTKAS